MAKIRVEINECPNGHNFHCISIGDTRVTPVKCCGSWRTLKYWMVEADELIGTIVEANYEAMRENARKNRNKVANA